MKKYLIVPVCLVLFSGAAWAGPMQVDGDITVVGTNDVDVTSIGGAEAYALGFIGTSSGNVEDASTNVGGVDIHNKKVGRNQNITVINNNRGTVTNYGGKVSVGGVQLGKKYE